MNFQANRIIIQNSLQGWKKGREQIIYRNPFFPHIKKTSTGQEYLLRRSYNHAFPLCFSVSLPSSMQSMSAIYSQTPLFLLKGEKRCLKMMGFQFLQMLEWRESRNVCSDGQCNFYSFRNKFLWKTTRPSNISHDVWFKPAPQTGLRDIPCPRLQ